MGGLNNPSLHFVLSYGWPVCCIRAVPVTGERISSPQIAQRMLGDVGASDVTENASPKVEQLVITPFDEGTRRLLLLFFVQTASF